VDLIDGLEPASESVARIAEEAERTITTTAEAVRHA
jgi:hypothetical protein